MSEREELEKKLAELKKQRDEITRQEKPVKTEKKVFEGIGEALEQLERDKENGKTPYLFRAKEWKEKTGEERQKKQHKTIKSPVIDEDKVLSQIMELDYEVCGVISNILNKNGNPDPDGETNRLMDGYRGIEKKLIGQLGLKKKLQEMMGSKS